MSTRPRIGILAPDGTIRSVYCHSDGYPTWNGQKLRDHYSSTKRVKALLALGDLSCINDLLDPTLKDRKEGHTFAYSMRGDPLNPPRKDASLENFLSEGEEYAYLWDGTKWRGWELHGEPREFDITLELVAERLMS